MKHTAFLFTLLLFFASLSAQPVTEKTVDKMCGCITESKDPVNSQKDVEALFFRCFMRDAMGDIEKLMKENKVKTLNEEGGRQIGIIIGQQLGVKCPAYMQKIEAMMKLSGGEETVEEVTPVATGITEANGQVTGVEVNCHTIFSLKFNDGTTAQLYWLQHFSGEDKLPASLQEMKEKSVRVGWRQTEIRNAATGRYETVNELMSLSW